MHCHRFKSSPGYINVISYNQKLLVVSLPGEALKITKEFAEILTGESGFKSVDKLSENAEKQIQAYFSGKLTKFNLPLYLTGTDFQKKILRTVANIPYGRTLTYKQVAVKAGSPKAARAVGTIMARNPLPIIIPCHRVLASKGYGGYAGGLKMKLKFLNLEGALK